jgi:hypothetical protein
VQTDSRSHERSGNNVYHELLGSDVSTEEGQKLALALCADYIECSAMTDFESVKRVFSTIVKLALDHKKRQRAQDEEAGSKKCTIQ